MFTTFYVGTWPNFGRSVSAGDSAKYAEVCRDRLRAELPDMASLIEVGDQANQGDPKVLAAIQLIYDRNWRYWIFQEGGVSEPAQGLAIHIPQPGDEDIQKNWPLNKPNG